MNPSLVVKLGPQDIMSLKVNAGSRASTSSWNLLEIHDLGPNLTACQNLHLNTKFLGIFVCTLNFKKQNICTGSSLPDLFLQLEIICKLVSKYKKIKAVPQGCKFLEEKTLFPSFLSSSFFSFPFSFSLSLFPPLLMLSIQDTSFPTCCLN